MKHLAILSLLTLAGCFNHGTSLPKADQALAGAAPTPAAFRYCSDHGCEVQHQVSLSAAAWATITAPLAAGPATPAAERAAVAEAVARFERAVGPETGTDGDVAGTQVFASRGQLDCVDEAVNTSRLLVMLQDAGLLQFHTAGSPVHRAFVGAMSTHMTAVLLERGGRAYAVDSWFRPSGQPADVIDLDSWLEGWQPADVVL